MFIQSCPPTSPPPPTPPPRPCTLPPNTHFHLCRFQVPGLAVVLVGERKDSQTYVRNKKKGCEEVGILSFGANLPETASEEEVLQVCVRRGPVLYARGSGRGQGAGGRHNVH